MRIISEHDTTIPLFYYIAFQNNHEPLEAPDEYIELYPSSWRQDRRWCKPHSSTLRSADVREPDGCCCCRPQTPA